MNREFGKLHPAVSLILFLLLIVLGSACISPVLSPVSLLAAVLAVAVTGRSQKLLPALRMMLPLAVVVLAVNVLFNGNGVTLLFTVFSRPVTLEALIYGGLSVISFSAVLLWACLLGETLGADEIIYLFGGISPYFALLMSMIIGMIPTMLNRLRQIRDLRKSGVSQKKAALSDITALVFWSLEESLVTAASMRSRGFDTGKVTRFVSYRFRMYDVAVLSLCLLFAAAMISAKATGYSYSVYPLFAMPQFNAQTLCFSASFVALMFIPFLHEVREKIRWKYLMSRA